MGWRIKEDGGRAECIYMGYVVQCFWGVAINLICNKNQVIMAAHESLYVPGHIHLPQIYTEKFF